MQPSLLVALCQLGPPNSDGTQLDNDFTSSWSHGHKWKGCTDITTELVWFGLPRYLFSSYDEGRRLAAECSIHLVHSTQCHSPVPYSWAWLIQCFCFTTNSLLKTSVFISHYPVQVSYPGTKQVSWSGSAKTPSFLVLPNSLLILVQSLDTAGLRYWRIIGKWNIFTSSLSLLYINNSWQSLEWMSVCHALRCNIM
jgi:hypothetical protein